MGHHRLAAGINSLSLLIRGEDSREYSVVLALNQSHVVKPAGAAGRRTDPLTSDRLMELIRDETSTFQSCLYLTVGRFGGAAEAS